MNVAKDLGAGGLPMVLSETSAVSCCGCKGVSDTFVHSLWFVDLLGRAVSEYRLHQLYRQALFGPDAYALVQTAGGRFARATPDYFATLLWSRLVGSVILGVAGGVDGGTLRLHAACAKDGGGVVVVFANWAPTPVNVTLAVAGVVGGGSGGVYGGWREEYHLTPTSGGLTSPEVSLNGGGALGVESELAPWQVAGTGAGADVRLAGHSFGFLVLVNASTAACLCDGRAGSLSVAALHGRFTSLQTVLQNNDAVLGTFHIGNNKWPPFCCSPPPRGCRTRSRRVAPPSLPARRPASGVRRRSAAPNEACGSAWSTSTSQSSPPRARSSARRAPTAMRT